MCIRDSFNFDRIPRVVGGPYEFGVPGAKHAILDDDEEGAEVTSPQPAVAGASAGAGSSGGSG